LRRVAGSRLRRPVSIGGNEFGESEHSLSKDREQGRLTQAAPGMSLLLVQNYFSGRDKMKSIMWPVAAVFAGTLCPALMHASGPIGVYARVDKVTFEPNTGKEERIRISGVFIAAEERADNSVVYSAPRRGYLYLTLPKGNEELARKEWADLKSVAGTRQVVGLGSGWGTKVRVRKPDEEAKAPDEYPLGNGLVKINSDQPRAQALLGYKDR
jgi:hypothetical protein